MAGPPALAHDGTSVSLRRSFSITGPLARIDLKHAIPLAGLGQTDTRHHCRHLPRIDRGSLVGAPHGPVKREMTLNRHGPVCDREDAWQDTVLMSRIADTQMRKLGL